MARLNARQLIETIQTYQPSYIYATHSLPRSPFDVADVVHLAMTLQSYQLREAIRDFDSAFDFYPTGMPQQVNELARRLDAMTYIEQIRQTQDPNYSYPRADYSEADLDFLSDLAISGGSECTAFYDADFANYFDAQQLEVFIGDGVANGALALDENGDWYVPLSEVDELAYGDYTASGGTLSRADWEIAGEPANLLAEGIPEATPNSDGSFNPQFWNNEIRFQGNRVFQRDDLIDPNRLDDLNRSNLERMQAGIAPVGPDGESINLHHLTQSPTGAIAEVTASMHRQSSAILHINPNSVPSGVNRADLERWRRQYWQMRANDFI